MFDEHRYRPAIDIYRKLIREGDLSVEVTFNLASCIMAEHLHFASELAETGGVDEAIYEHREFYGHRRYGASINRATSILEKYELNSKNEFNIRMCRYVASCRVERASEIVDDLKWLLRYTHGTEGRPAFLSMIVQELVSIRSTHLMKDIGLILNSDWATEQIKKIAHHKHAQLELLGSE